VLGRGDLALPAVTYFVFWQVQETLRRGLLAELRHRAALPGDGISYLGQFLLVALLSARGSLSPATALYAMGATSGLAALIQWRQLSIRLGGPQSVKDIVRDFSSIGGWALGNNILFTLRGLISSWTLAFTYGAVSVGLLQAALNVIFVVNPIILGLWSIIPQSVALARKGDDIAAWQAARGLGSVGAIPVGLFYVLVLTFSETILSIFYGSNSYSAEISTAVRILAVAGMMNYMAEVVSAYLYGVGAPKKALVLNGISTGSHALCAVPLVITHGLEGACIATVLAGAVRLAGTPWILRKTIRRSINTFSI
jgi:O-antigen/teichoic acid export membrane protein